MAENNNYKQISLGVRADASKLPGDMRNVTNSITSSLGNISVGKILSGGLQGLPQNLGQLINSISFSRMTANLRSGLNQSVAEYEKNFGKLGNGLGQAISSAIFAALGSGIVANINTNKIAAQVANQIVSTVNGKDISSTDKTLVNAKRSAMRGSVSSYQLSGNDILAMFKRKNAIEDFQHKFFQSSTANKVIARDNKEFDNTINNALNFLDPKSLVNPLFTPRMGFTPQGSNLPEEEKARLFDYNKKRWIYSELYGDKKQGMFSSSKWATPSVYSGIKPPEPIIPEANNLKAKLLNQIITKTIAIGFLKIAVVGAAVATALTLTIGSLYKFSGAIDTAAKMARGLGSSYSAFMNTRFASSVGGMTENSFNLGLQRMQVAFAKGGTSEVLSKVGYNQNKYDDSVIQLVELLRVLKNLSTNERMVIAGRMFGRGPVVREMSALSARIDDHMKELTANAGTLNYIGEYSRQMEDLHDQFERVWFKIKISFISGLVDIADKLRVVFSYIPFMGAPDEPGNLEKISRDSKISDKISYSKSLGFRYIKEHEYHFDKLNSNMANLNVKPLISRDEFDLDKEKLKKVYGDYVDISREYNQEMGAAIGIIFDSDGSVISKILKTSSMSKADIELAEKQLTDMFETLGNIPSIIVEDELKNIQYQQDRLKQIKAGDFSDLLSMEFTNPKLMEFLFNQRSGDVVNKDVALRDMDWFKEANTPDIGNKALDKFKNFISQIKDSITHGLISFEDGEKYGDKLADKLFGKDFESLFDAIKTPIQKYTEFIDDITEMASYTSGVEDLDLLKKEKFKELFEPMIDNLASISGDKILDVKNNIRKLSDSFKEIEEFISKFPEYASSFDKSKALRNVIENAFPEIVTGIEKLKREYIELLQAIKHGYITGGDFENARKSLVSSYVSKSNTDSTLEKFSDMKELKGSGIMSFNEFESSRKDMISGLIPKWGDEEKFSKLDELTKYYQAGMLNKDEYNLASFRTMYPGAENLGKDMGKLENDTALKLEELNAKYFDKMETYGSARTFNNMGDLGTSMLTAEQKIQIEMRNMEKEKMNLMKDMHRMMQERMMVAVAG